MTPNTQDELAKKATKRSFIVRIELPTTRVVATTRAMTRTLNSRYNYNLKFEDANTDDRDKIIADLSVSIRNITGELPLILESSDAMVINATIDQVDALRKLQSVKDILPNSELMRLR